MLRYFLSLSLIFLCSCSVHRIQSVPSIKQTAGWSIAKTCGYEGCGPYVDHLKGNGFELRIEAYNYWPNEKYLTIGLTFVTPVNSVFTFNPSQSSVELSDGMRLVSRGFPCNTVPFERNVAKAVSLGRGNIHFNKSWDCFRLEFDCNPSVYDKFSLKIGGLQTDNHEIEIPILFFAPQER
jgi:hypothetical protein